MNELIQNELTLLMSVGDCIKGSEQVKILSILSAILSNEKYVSDLKTKLNPIVEDSNYNFSDFSRLILHVIELNKHYDFYKEVNEYRVKYILWGVIYYYFTKFQIEKLNLYDLSSLRIMYLNCAELVLLVPETIKINKESFSSCLGRYFSFLKCLDKKNKI